MFYLIESINFFIFLFWIFSKGANRRQCHEPVRLTTLLRLIRIKWRAFINFQNLTANVVPEQWRQSETLIVATCSCPLLRYFGTLFRNSEENSKHFVRPGWYYDTYDVHVIWREKFAQLWKTLTILVCTYVLAWFFSKSKEFLRVRVSKELNHLAAILHVYAGGLNFMK